MVANPTVLGSGTAAHPFADHEVVKVSGSWHGEGHRVAGGGEGRDIAIAELVQSPHDIILINKCNRAKVAPFKYVVYMCVL